MHQKLLLTNYLSKMKKLATKLTPAIKDWIKDETGNDKTYQVLYNYVLSNNGNFLFSNNLGTYTEVSEAEFLAEFGKPKVEYQFFANEIWFDAEFPIRIKPTPDYSKEIEVLQNKAKENGMTVTINFEKL